MLELLLHVSVVCICVGIGLWVVSRLLGGRMDAEVLSVLRGAAVIILMIYLIFTIAEAFGLFSLPAVPRLR